MMEALNQSYPRDFIVKEAFTPVERSHYQRSLFPTFKTCTAVEFSRKNRSRLDNRTLIWSSLVDLYLIPDERIFTENAKLFLQKAYAENIGYIEVQNGILIFVPLTILLALIGAFLIPFFGSILFWLCERIYLLLTNRLFRKVGRRILIELELYRRKREVKLIKYAEITQKPPRPKFRLPKFFRDHSDEDVPEILQKEYGQVQDYEDSDDFNAEDVYSDLQKQEAESVKLEVEKKVQLIKALEEKKEEEEKIAAQEKTKEKTVERRKSKLHAKKSREELLKAKNKAIRLGLPLTNEMKSIKKKKVKTRKNK